MQVALEEASDLVGVAGVVHDLGDELTVICAYANLGGDVSYDAELTEDYFGRIESAGKNAARLMRQLLPLELPVFRDGGGTNATTPVVEQMTVPADAPVLTASSGSAPRAPDSLKGCARRGVRNESWPCKSNPVCLGSYVSRAARREIAGFRPGFWPQGQSRHPSSFSSRTDSRGAEWAQPRLPS